MNGFLLVDKPAGCSSFDVVWAIRRTLPRKTKVGHAGTLDPFATGLLIVLVGSATRLMPWVVGHDKRYDLTVQFGARSTTDDLEGDIEQVTDGFPAHDAVEAAVAGIRAQTEQVPPAVSAIHVDGERAYRRVRRGETIDVPARPVRFAAIDVVAYDQQAGTLRLDVRSSTGTYMRSVARDLGDALGVGGYASVLVRREVGEWSLDDAVPLATLRESEFEPGRLRPLDELVCDHPVVTLDERDVVSFSHGQRVGVSGGAAGDVVGVLGPSGTLVGMAELQERDDTMVLKPSAVFVRPPEPVR